MFLTLLFAFAHAGELQVLSDGPVTVEVDGRAVPTRPGERGATASNLAGGNHRVQVFDAQDRLLASSTVDVPVTEQVRLEVRRGQLVELGRGPLASSGPAAHTCPELPAAKPGSFQLTGISSQDVAVWVDGQPVRASSAGFVASDLSAGYHDVRVVQGRRTLYSGRMRIHSELVRRCVPADGTLDCVFVETVVAVPPVVTAPPTPPPPVSRPPPGPTPMADRDFTSLVAAVRAESFSSDKLGVITSASRGSWFTIAQLGQILDQLSHSSDKVDAARVLAPRVVDPQNAWKLNEHLTFSSDKDAVQALFR